VQQVLYDNAAVSVIEGIARHDSLTTFKEDSAIVFSTRASTATKNACAPWVLGHGRSLFDLGAVS
jgi:hypothetical protein